MIHRTSHLLGQSEAGGSALLWALVLVVALVVMFGAVAAYRKWMKSDDTTSGPGFTLSDLRKLHKEGKMTDAEYEKAKSILVGSAKVGADKPVLGEAQRPRTHSTGFDARPPEN